MRLKKQLSLLIFAIAVGLSARSQSICVNDDFEQFKNNIDANCRNLIISNITLVHNGFRFQIIGDTPELDSFADYVSRNQAKYQVHFETADNSWSNEQKIEVEKAVHSYIVKRDSSNADKIQPHENVEENYESLLPKNVKSAFFMMLSGYQETE